MQKLHSVAGRASRGATNTAWSALRKKIGLSNGHKGRRGSNRQSANENDDDEDDGGAAQQVQDDGDEDCEASDAADDQEDWPPTKRVNSRGQVTLKAELEAKRQAAGKRPDGRKMKPLEKKKPAKRKKTKDRVPKKTNLQKYVWIPPQAEGEDVDDTSETTETDKAEARPDIGEEISQTVETEEQPSLTEQQQGPTEPQQSPIENEPPAQKRKTPEEEYEVDDEEGFIATAELPEALDIQHLVKRRKKVHDAGDEETGEGAVSADSTPESAEPASGTGSFAEGEIDRLFEL